MSPTLLRRGLAALALLGGVGWLATSSTGVAQPPGPATFCEAYPTSPSCTSGAVACTTCHTSPPELNVYGLDVSAALAPDEARPLHADVFSDRLGEALRAVEALDSDLDGYDNLAEIQAGTAMSDPASHPALGSGPCTDEAEDDAWDVCGYDPDYAYKRVLLGFCGRSPTLLERETFAAAERPGAKLHDALDDCLDSEYWRGIDGQVWNLANAKINPQQAVKAGVDAGPIPLADYDDDFAYFVWTQTDDRDVRLVLTGKEFVRATYQGGVTVYEPWGRSPDKDLEERGFDRYQAVVKPRRAGMLTHRWFLMSNTMFTAVPRTTAAQAYRAYLGTDIARLEGLHPVPGEPVDYDSKDVDAPDCAVCHSTLDPLTYPFSRYEGIGNGYSFSNQYEYNEDRMAGFVATDGERVLDTPEAGVLLGQPVADLVEWAEVAANSEAFRRATVLDYWELLLDEPPRVDEQAELAALIGDLGRHWNVETMLHDFIDTEAFGAP
jgi:hypothetical protein